MTFTEQVSFIPDSYHNFQIIDKENVGFRSKKVYKQSESVLVRKTFERSENNNIYR